jgi:hypothetical protein
MLWKNQLQPRMNAHQQRQEIYFQQCLSTSIGGLQSLHTFSVWGKHSAQLRPERRDEYIRRDPFVRALEKDIL